MKYDPAKIETKWQKKWASSKAYASKEGASKEKYYVLDMFPYPSGDGLHVGHPKGYIATDVISRMKRMQGRNVLHPMGFDAFGLPAENYALKTRTNPEIAVRKNVARFKKQLEIIGLDYDWSREVNTTDPAYYRWTQWIFLQLFKKGLAYESYEPVNWCPTDKTVLANEDVENGRCERCGTPVEKKPMRQWVLKITDYADRLLDDLDATKGVPTVVRIEGDDAFRPGEPVVERWPVVCIIKHWSEDKYLCSKWHATGWQGFVIGGVEDGETMEQAAIREIREETGYKNAHFVREIGKVDAKFFQKVKNVNRHAHFTGLYLELADGDQADVSAEERSLQDFVWVPRSEVHDFTTHADMTYLWDLFTGAQKQEIRPLLDWPESIKEAQRNWIGRSEGAEIGFRLTLEKKKPRFVILHGYKGGAKLDFFPWLRAELEKRGHEVEMPDLPNTLDPKESEQVDHVLKNCHFDENTVVIGHSLGCVVALKTLMKLNKPISGLVLVAPAIQPGFSSDAKPRIFHKSFIWDFDYGQIKNLTGGKIAVLSDLTEEFRAPYLKYLSDKLSAKLIETHANAKHFNSAQEPEVLDAVTLSVGVFTTRPDTLFGVTYLVLAPEHPWIQDLLPYVENAPEVKAYISKAARETEIERTDASKEKTGIELKGVKAINPANNKEVPVWIADYVLADYGTGAVMAVPAHDERDQEFAAKFGLSIKRVVAGGEPGIAAYVGDGKLIDSGPFTGKESASVKREITESVGGKWVTKYKLRDWVFSRQRYWGEPIPLIRCEKHGVMPVPEKDLPVKLPKVKSYEPTGTGESPLAAISKWVNVKCPICKGPAKRETNTMPQWAGSCWYYLRYMDPRNRAKLVDPRKERYWSPVDLYVGGAEHATRHLIYARFWHKFLYDIGAVSTVEPFMKLQSVGLIMGEDGRKMSKRFGNVVNPDDIIKAYGADTLRLYEMFMGPFDQSIPWSTDSIVGCRRFVERVWRLRDKVLGAGSFRGRGLEPAKRPQAEGKSPAPEALRILNKTIMKVTEDIQNLRFNTAVSSLMIAVNETDKAASVDRDQYETLLKLLAPFAPHAAEELWASLGNKRSIHLSAWPAYDPALVADGEATIIVQVNGRVRGSFKAATDSSQEALETAARALPEIKKWIEGREIRRIISVPGRLVNIVV